MSERRQYLHADFVEILEGFDRTLTEDDFEPYQQWMLDLLLEKKHVLLGAFMGSGKTGVCLCAARKLLDAGEAKRVLVVAPLAVARDTWPDEIMAWDFARRFEFSVIVGSEEEREAARLRDCELHIVNRENFRWLYNRWGYRSWPYDLLIYDEASRMKGGSAKTKPAQRKDGSVSQPRRSEFGYLCHVRPKLKRVWELSGTPAPNGLEDLWGPIYLLDGGKRLGSAKYKFEQRWFERDKYTMRLTPHEHSHDEIMGRIKDVFFALKEEDYIELPDLVVRDRYVRLSDKHMRMYKEFERTLALEQYDIEAVNNGVLCNKLLQFANGSVYNEDGEDKHVHDRKLEELESIVAESGGRPLLIAYSYRFDLKAIKKKFPRFRIFGEGKDDLRDWNRGRLPGMILHPASAAHGLNFQHGGNIAVWYGLNWSLELYQQFIKRLHRRGQKAERVFMYRILAKATNDERVARLLSQKDTSQERITDSVRVRLDEIREAA